MEREGERGGGLTERVRRGGGGGGGEGGEREREREREGRGGEGHKKKWIGG